jgi:hypothetical protein
VRNIRAFLGRFGIRPGERREAPQPLAVA